MQKIAICVTGQHRVPLGTEDQFQNHGLSLFVRELESYNIEVHVYEMVWKTEEHQSLPVVPYNRHVLLDDVYHDDIMNNIQYLKRDIPEKIKHYRPNLTVETYTKNIHAQLYAFDIALRNIKRSGVKYNMIMRWRRDTFIREDIPVDIIVRPIIQMITAPDDMDKTILTGAIHCNEDKLIIFEDELFGLKYEFAMDIINEDDSTINTLIEIQRNKTSSNRLDPHRMWIEYFKLAKNHKCKYFGALYNYLGSYVGNSVTYDENAKSWIINDKHSKIASTQIRKK